MGVAVGEGASVGVGLIVAVGVGTSDTGVLVVAGKGVSVGERVGAPVGVGVGSEALSKSHWSKVRPAKTLAYVDRIVTLWPVLTEVTWLSRSGGSRHLIPSGGPDFNLM